MPETIDVVKSDVLRHEIEHRALSESLNRVILELKDLSVSLRSIAIINEKIENVNSNLKRIESEVTDIKDLRSDLKTLSHLMYGSGGKNGLASDVEDLKKMLHRAIGALLLINISLGLLIKFL